MFAYRYLQLYKSGGLQRRVEESLKGLKTKINRLDDQKKVCRTGRYARVSSYFAHFGEEDACFEERRSGIFAQKNIICSI